MVSFIKNFHASCINQFLEAVYHFRRVFFQLLQNNPSHAVGYLKFAACLVYQLKNNFVSRKIAFVRYFFYYSLIFMLVKIMVVMSYLKYRVSSKPKRLVHLEIKANAYHFCREFFILCPCI